MSTSFDIIVIGGGTGGIMTASQMLKAKPSLNIAIIEPSDTHYYQPAWTLVGAGDYDYKKTARPMASVMPKKARWIKDRVIGLKPEENALTTALGNTYSYKYMVLSPGLTYDYSLVEGLGEAMDKGIVCSVYTDPIHVNKVLNNFKGGTALFTMPTTPIKCGGAPQKIMYLADSFFRKRNVRKNSKVVFATPGGVIFGVKPIAKTLTEVIDKKDIYVRYGHQLVKVDAEKQIAWYKLGDNARDYNKQDIQVDEENGLVGIHYDMLHTAPPSVAPDFVRYSNLVSEGGWLDVDIHTMQHKKFPNIFGIGDAAALPTAKTGAAIRKQVPVVIDNIFILMEHSKIGTMSYNGYSSCPLVTDYGKMVLAEFDYQNNFTPDPKLKQLLIKDSSKEHWRLWILKKYMLPYLYWNKMMKGENV
jgi:sulfide:quinone oxidoreductase